MYVLCMELSERIILNVLSDLTDVMAGSTNWDELEWAWEGWRDATGRQMPDMYEEFVGYQNQAAVMNGK